MILFKFHLVFTSNIYGKSVTRTFLGAIFWVPIMLKQYQNTSGWGTVHTAVKCFAGSKLLLLYSLTKISMLISIHGKFCKGLII